MWLAKNLIQVEKLELTICKNSTQIGLYKDDHLYFKVSLYLHTFQTLQWDPVSSPWSLGELRKWSCGHKCGADKRRTTLGWSKWANPSCIQEDYAILHILRDMIRC